MSGCCNSPSSFADSYEALTCTGNGRAEIPNLGLFHAPVVGAEGSALRKTWTC